MKKTETNNAFSCLQFGVQLHNKYPNYFALVDKYISEHNIIIGHLQEMKIEANERNLFTTICIVQSYKAADTAISLSKLVSAGLSGDAATVCRKLLEQAITILYIAKDPVKRSSMYINHPCLNQVDRVDQFINSKHSTEALKSSLKEIRTDAIKAQKAARKIFNFPQDKKIPYEYQTNWSGLNLKKMAEKVGLGRDYFYTYVLFSQVTHSGASNLPEYLDLEKSEFRPRHELSALLLTLLNGLKSYHVVLETFEKSLGHESSCLRALREELDLFESLPELRSNELVFRP